MATKSKLVQRWRSLRAGIRNSTYAGLAALLAIIGAAISHEIEGGIAGIIDRDIHTVLAHKCRWDLAHKRTPTTPVILIAGFLNDPDDVTRNALESSLAGAGDDFDIIRSCTRFERHAADSFNEARDKLITSIKPEIDAVNADLVLYGVALAPRIVNLWSGNFLGGCEWQEKPTFFDLSTPTSETSQTVLDKTRSALLGVIVTGLVAACQRQQDSDWQAVGRIFDIVDRYIHAHESDLGDQYSVAVQNLFALSYTRYAASGETVWFNRALHALDVLRAQLPNAFYEETLAVLYYRNYQYSKSNASLEASFSHIKTAQRSGANWTEVLDFGGDTVVAMLQKAAQDGQQNVTQQQVTETQAANAAKR
ncbi:hypothetical protein [Bradyrhizobium sp. SZCCHNS1054]|uniref:hypothetical protein n=1 Tax=Bradyrhizobium sp. SZCCHNS1054 TaxID=3057301 RepID=UPI0029160464|nr:hypothetical protein [Bradyrhizobium sp. SZCCHNS1054]